MFPEVRAHPKVKEILEDIDRTIRNEFPKIIEKVDEKVYKQSVLKILAEERQDPKILEMSPEEFIRTSAVPEKAVFRTDNYIQSRIRKEIERAEEQGIVFSRDEAIRLQLSALPDVAADSFAWARGIFGLFGIKLDTMKYYKLVGQKTAEYYRKIEEALPTILQKQ